MESSHLIALTSLITSSVQEIVSAHASAGQSPPTLSSVEPGLFDSLTVEDVPEGLAHAIQVVEAACTQLMYSVSRPGAVLLSKAKTHMEVACLSAVLNAGIPDLLADKPEGMDVNQLAELSGFTAGADILERVMRLLASKHVFRQVKPGVYTHNRLSVKLLSKEAVSHTVGAISEDWLWASVQISQILTTPGGFKKSAFQRATGYKFFDYYGLPEHAGKGERFQRSMAGWGEIFGIGYLSKVYPWKAQPAGTTICDIGGGTGHVTMGPMKDHPHLKLVIQDSEAAVQIAREFWTNNCPEAMEEGRVDFVPFDFLKDAAVAGCDVYYLKNILYHWTDAECVTILKNVRKAMKPGSRVIIQEVVVRKALNWNSPETASDPQLPSWGPSEVNTYEHDILMMELFQDAKDRTLEEVVELGNQSGLEFKQMYPAGGMGLVEFSPV